MSMKEAMEILNRVYADIARNPKIAPYQCYLGEKETGEHRY